MQSKPDSLTYFKDPSIMECLLFKMINEMGESEKGEGLGVLSEVFAISMTIGERNRVSLDSNDHFVDEWEALDSFLLMDMSAKY